MKVKWLVLPLLLTVTLPARSKDPVEITVPELRQHIGYLASDELGGRKPGSAGDQKAAEYIRKELKKNKLQLMADKGFQSFEVIIGAEAGDQNSLAFADFSGVLGQDFTPLAFTSNATVDAPVVFVGYGFDFKTDSLTWNDYEGVDVDGKWVLVLREAPDDGAPNSGFEPYMTLRKKVLVAKDHGAAGVLFVSGEKADKDDELIPLRHEQSSAGAGLPVLHIQRKVADAILATSGLSTVALETAIHDSLAAKSMVLRQSVKAVTDVTLKRAMTQNVVALLEGSDALLKNEYIVIGAHYDHLGMGGPGSGSRRPDTSAVHNGADDNASGVAAILEIVEKLAGQRKQLKRSIIFVAFSAEEMGTLGSKYFVENPLVPLKQIKFMFNLDMVGRLDPVEKTFSIGGTGTAAGLENLLTQALINQPIKAKYSSEGYGPSDHAAFYAKDISVLFFMAGMHEDYHTPADDADKINYEGEKELADIVTDLIKTVANRSEAMAFQEAGPKTQPVSTGRRFKVTFGIMPDFTSSGVKGVRAEVVMPNRPAARAGMQKGDVIVAIEGKSVNDIYEYMGRLSDLRQGQRVSVEVLRGDKKEILIIEL